MLKPYLMPKSLSSYNPLPNGCVLYLPFWSPNLGGSTFKSADLFGWTCTATNTTQGAKGRIFAGADYITIAGVEAQLQSLTVGTIEVWAMMTSVAASRIFFSAGDIGDVTSYMGLYYNQVINRINAICYNDGNEFFNEFFTGDPTMAVDTWYHLFLTQDGTQPDLYRGKPTTALTKYDMNASGVDDTGWFADVLNLDTVTLGMARRSGGDYLPMIGTIGEVRVYNRVLTLAEAEHIHDATKWRYS